MSKPNLHSLLIPIGSVVLIFLLIVVKKLTTIYIPNEVDFLPFARQFWDSSWLRSDWYLNLGNTYRNLFSLVIGPLVSWLGFDIGRYLGRLLVYLFLSVAIYEFFKSIRMNIVIGLLVLFIFLSHQSIVAAEWVVEGIDTKTVSYSFVILSWAALIRKRYLSVFAFLGAALSFHPLVGIYAVYCSVPALLVNKEWRSDWRMIIKKSWPFFITGVFGIWTIFVFQFQYSALDPSPAWGIYTAYRLRHHLFPGSWGYGYWMVILFFSFLLFGAVFVLAKSNSLRFLAAYALASLSLFIIGLGIYAFGDVSLLRFYWFRFPDVIVPFLGLIISGLVVQYLLKNLGTKIFTLPEDSLFWKIFRSKYAGKIAALAVIIVIFGVASISAFGRIQSEMQSHSPIRDMEVWIAGNTPKDSTFFINPKIEDFYIFAERPVFVTFKHLPQSAPEIMEWYERIKLCNGNRAPQKTGFDSLDEIEANFYNLDEDAIRSIAESYGVNYYLGVLRKDLPFKLVYSDRQYALYEIQ
jgi:hypothetical protein